MNNNNSFYNNPYAQGNFNNYGQPQTATPYNSTLTPEEFKMLQKQQNEFSLGLTEEEKLRAICNHRTPDGLNDTLEPFVDPVTGETKTRCKVCGYVFDTVSQSTSKEEIQEEVKDVIDVLQTIKIMFTDLPRDAARDYFQIIPMLEKIPQLFEYAVRSMNKHDGNNNWQYNNGSTGYRQMFDRVQSMLGGGAMPYGQYQQPMMNGGYMGGYQQQPMMNNGFAQTPYQQPQNNMGMGNPFGYNGANPNQPQQYQPQTQGFSYTPNQAPQQPQAQQQNNGTNIPIESAPPAANESEKPVVSQNVKA